MTSNLELSKLTEEEVHYAEITMKHLILMKSIEIRQSRSPIIPLLFNSFLIFLLLLVTNDLYSNIIYTFINEYVFIKLVIVSLYAAYSIKSLYKFFNNVIYFNQLNKIASIGSESLLAYRNDKKNKPQRNIASLFLSFVISICFIYIVDISVPAISILTAILWVLYLDYTLRYNSIIYKIRAFQVLLNDRVNRIK